MNFALDALHHDLYLDANGQITITPAPLDQRIDTRIRTFRGEFWLDQSIGIDYFGEVLKKNPDLQAVRAAFAVEIQKVPGVKTLNALDITHDRAERKLTVTFSVTGTDALVYLRTTEVVA